MSKKQGFLFSAFIYLVTLSGAAMPLHSTAQSNELRILKNAMAKTNDSLKYMDLFNQAGFLLHMNSADSTFNYGLRGIRMAQGLRYPKGEAFAYSNLAVGLMLKGMYSQALSFYSRSYAIFNSMHDKRDVMQSLINQAIAYDLLGDSDKCLSYSRRSLNMAKTLSRDSVTSMIYINYATINPSLKKDSVNFYLAKGLSIAAAFHDQRAELAVAQIRAAQLLAERDYNAARKTISSILYIARSNHWDYHELEGLGLLARYHSAVRKPDRAIAVYRQVYQAACKRNFSFWETETLDDLIECFKLKGDLHQQLYYNKLLVAALKKERDNNRNFIGDYLSYGLAQQSITHLKQTNNEQETWIRWLIALTTFGVILFALLVILYRRAQVISKRLIASDLFKSRLISILAHDFRAPLGSTLGLIELLRDGEMTQQYAQVLFINLESDIRTVLLTFDNLLTWIKQQDTGYHFNPQEVTLKELWDETGIFFTRAIVTGKLKLSLQIPPACRLFSDKEIIQFVNRNLLHNAIKHSPEGGQITVSVQISDKDFTVAVADNGPGMSPDRLKRLFSFNQTLAGDSKGGAGMALTIAKDLLAKMGGAIYAESSPGEGTTFYYSLPRGHIKQSECS